MSILFLLCKERRYSALSFSRYRPRRIRNLLLRKEMRNEANAKAFAHTRKSFFFFETGISLQNERTPFHRKASPWRSAGGARQNHFYPRTQYWSLAYPFHFVHFPSPVRPLPYRVEYPYYPYYPYSGRVYPWYSILTKQFFQSSVLNFDCRSFLLVGRLFALSFSHYPDPVG